MWVEISLTQIACLVAFDNRKNGVLYSGTLVEIKSETIKLINTVGKKGTILGAVGTLSNDIDLSHIKAWRILQEIYKKKNGYINMWKIRDLKKKARGTFKRNYIGIVITCFIAAVVMGSFTNR